jgi:hypothetical protein
VPLPELLASRAGRLIFGELIEGSTAANRILGKRIANVTRRMELLSERLGQSRLTGTADELESRLNRIYDGFATEHPGRARELFQGSSAADSALVRLSEGERRTIRDLVIREFKRPMSFRSAREEFVRGRSGLSPEEHAFIYWETRKNAVSTRSAEAVAIEHYEVPLELVQADLAARMPRELRDSLVFSRGGRRFVRWIINPEDTLHHKAVAKLLRAHGESAAKHRYFQGFRTASRSYVIVDPATGRRTVFSAKVSTNNTGGNWKDKKQPVEDAYEARRAADLVIQEHRARPFRNVVPMDEPAMFGLNDIDQAMLVRVLGDLPAGEVTYLPGFSALHEDLGVRIAQANGYADVAAFWNEHYNKPLARAIAELSARTGLTYDSPHSQNFLIEMVGVNPTGRILMRDFGDTYALAGHFKASGRADFLKRWETDNITTNFDVSVGVTHGNTPPRWLNETTYKKWGRDFYATFEDEFSSLTGIPAAELQATRARRNGAYFSKEYDTSTAAWKSYFEKLRRQGR